MAITATSTVAMVREKFPQAVLETVDFRGEQTIVLLPEHLVTLCAYLQKNQRYNFLATVTAVDWLERVPRYDVVYHLLSIPNQSEPGAGNREMTKRTYAKARYRNTIHHRR